MKGKIHWGKNAYGMMRYLKKVANGHYQLDWYGGVVDAKKIKKFWWVTVDGKYAYTAMNFNDALNWIYNVWGNEPVMTRNILNPAAGEFPIARKDYGGCCDPGTERYHCM